MERIESVDVFWADREEDGNIFLYKERPIKGCDNVSFSSVPNDWFKDVTVENSPQLVEIKRIHELRIIY
jgi:hypothetical protein